MLTQALLIALMTTLGAGMPAERWLDIDLPGQVEFSSDGQPQFDGVSQFSNGIVNPATLEPSSGKVEKKPEVNGPSEFPPRFQPNKLAPTTPKPDASTKPGDAASTTPAKAGSEPVNDFPPRVPASHLPTLPDPNRVSWAAILHQNPGASTAGSNGYDVASSTPIILTGYEAPSTSAPSSTPVAAAGYDAPVVPSSSSVVPPTSTIPSTTARPTPVVVAGYDVPASTPRPVPQHSPTTTVRPSTTSAHSGY